ncbi:MAG: S1 family peptidase [Myxococcaceae bacterium]
MPRAILPLVLLLSTSASAVVGGAPDPDDGAIVAITLGDFTLCSGVLVAKNAVLTAGHCLAPLGSAEVRLGEDVTHPTARIQIAEQLTHPNYSAEGAPYDFALLRLEKNVEDVAVVPLSDEAPTLGEQVVHIGYGVSDEAAGSGRGTRRKVSYPVTKVEAEIFYSGAAGEQTCDGDSGGAALGPDGKVIGIVSDGPNCHEDGWDGRVDLVAPWIRDQLQAWAPPEQTTPAPQHKGGCGSAGMVLAIVGLAVSKRGAFDRHGGGRYEESWRAGCG